MKIERTYNVPTGHILIVEGERGLLECLSLGDYGKDVNLNQHKAVRHTELLPLTDKWVITISTQYGCSMGCQFCDVPKVGPGRNATIDDLIGQVQTALSMHPEVAYTNRLNIHFARMGEPTWNWAVLGAANWFHRNLNPTYRVHPVVSTMMPARNAQLERFLVAWMRLKNALYEGNAGLQLSINSTDEGERNAMFNGNAMSIPQIGEVMRRVTRSSGTIQGRKITLNFAIADWTVDPSVLLKHFPPEQYIVKLTPMHKTAAADAHGIATPGDYTDFYPYLDTEAALKAAGYEVLTFIASWEEDASRITCGNAILAGTEPECLLRDVR